MKNKTLNLIKKLSPDGEEVELIKSFERIRQHYDEPKFWYYSASISDKYLRHDGKHFQSKSSGVSFFSRETAILKALAEAIERYNNFAFFEENVGYTGSYSKIRKKAINPKKFIFFSDKQLSQKKYKKFLINDNSLFRWTKFKLLTDKKSYYIPCQLVYLSYRPVNKEPVIYPSISTGAAGHFTLNSALLNGIYEVLERDAFMIYYLNKLKPRRYDLIASSNKKIKTLLEIAKRYHLQIISLDIRTNINVPTVASVIIDRSGLSKAVSVGLKSHLNAEKAIVGSINEAFHTRTWIREAYIRDSKSVTRSELIKDSSIKNRGIFWYSLKSICKINFLINNLELIKIRHKNDKLTVKDQIFKLKDALKEKGYKIYYKDITSKYFKDIPFKVVKVVIPGMQPIYLNEKYPLLGGERMRQVPGELGYKIKGNLNIYPHPFL